jgi:hypothetical protein
MEGKDCDGKGKGIKEKNIHATVLMVICTGT